VELLNIIADTTTQDGQVQRARQIDAVRAMLSHPRDAWTTDDRGGRVWTKPPKRTADNLRIILTTDPAFRARIRKNEFSGVI